MQSHPMWVRGLKLTVAALYVVNCVVAPYAGAWIETRLARCSLLQRRVAPYVDA